MSIQHSPIKYCPACGSRNNISAQFCFACGAASPAPPVTEGRPKRTNKTGLLIICGAAIIVFGGLNALTSIRAGKHATSRAGQIETPAPGASTPAPASTPDPKYGQRLAIAELTQQSLRELGCPDCSAAAIRDILIVTHPGRAPKSVASELLGHTELKNRFKDAGFTVLRVKQQTGMLADHFDYAIK